MISGWRSSAKRRGHVWNLTKAQLDTQFNSQAGICALSGKSMVSDKRSPFRYSLDRIDSSRGYCCDNIQFVCSAVNVMKNKLDEVVFVDFCHAISKLASTP